MEWVVRSSIRPVVSSWSESECSRWFMHDSAPAHFHLSVRRYLNRQYGEWWIGRGGPVLWPPRSPDLNPLDFCVWGYEKGLVYNRADIATLQELQYLIVHVFQQMKNDSGLLEPVYVIK